WAHVLERQDGDRSQSCGGFRALGLTRFFAGHQIVDPHGVFDVAELPLSNISEGETFLIAHLLVDLAGDVNASGRREPLDTAGDINSASKEMLSLLQYVSKMDADLGQKRLLASLALIAGSEILLDGDRGADGIHGAAECRKQTVSHGVDDFSRALLNRFGGDLPVFAEELESLGFALLHEIAVADHVAEHNRCETSLGMGALVRQLL